MKERLIVYYSRTGLTRHVAEQLAPMLDADVEEIREAKDRSGPLGWISAGKDATLRHQAELTSTHSVEGRKMVIIGMPVWAFSPPPAIRTYLAKMPLAGKTVCAFCTSGGSGGDKTLEEVASLVPGGLAARLSLTRVSPKDATLIPRLQEWAKKVVST
jgi:flavodoxin